MPKERELKHKKRRKNTGYSGGKPCGMNYLDMLQWQKSLQEKAEKFAKDETQRVLADRQAQRMAWLYIVALNEKFSFGPKRTEELEAEVKRLSDAYAQNVDKHGQDYADEDLRRRVSQVRGHDVKYLYEDQYPVNSERKGTDVAEDQIAALRESESRIY